MSDVQRCAACRKEKPVSEMKVCMHAEMHNYVCDSKCMHDFYNPPKAETTGHAAIIAALQSTLSAAEAERDQLRAELAAIRGQEPVAYVSAEAVGGVYWRAGMGEFMFDDRAPLYALPPQQPDAVSVPRELTERLEARMAECSPMKEHWDTLEELRALLFTRQAEEGE